MLRRRLAALALLVVAAGAITLGLTRPWGDSAGSGDTTSATPPPPAGADAPEGGDATQLPRGGRRLLPDYRLVALYGAPQAAELGALGRGTPAQDMNRLARLARPYAADGATVQPVAWLIASISSNSPEADGSYRAIQDDATIRRYLAAARRARALLVLDLQPGRADILAEVRRLEPFLSQPDVGLALDPEWTLAAGATPADGPGSLDRAVVARVAAELTRIVRANDLPQKLLAVHRFSDQLLTGSATLRSTPQVAIAISANPIGPFAKKRDVYARYAASRDGLFGGIKLFFEEDPSLVAPRDILSLRPPPNLVIYE